ncbi:Shedu anti-phage system protein SduA domain-containing protein [Pseudomonas sp. B14(2022)]|uniref:Shedu anti-phage system protein SduA domain-containing protein n=1 Tax=Pseudomonas sp. B14(2022) TaxID=2914043 RepID=UPI0014302D25|nr:Shedu anti-phage system protein SduA domain-containing protein [Pseudomonas sp. B14(2022)]NJJ56228.1 DUF4263 domain-containing protein [Pseudomonas sp. B14(2022)]
MLHTRPEIQNIVSSFINLINTPMPSKPGKKRIEQKEAPSSKNAYKVRGSQAQRPKEAPKSSYVINLEERGDDHHEKHLQKAIIDNPFLLHTPELYAGGLYLDSLLNQLRLPFSRITDFCYLTTQGRTIKITLVEIEQSAKRVFTRDVLGGEYFHKDTIDAIDQVKDWQKHLNATCHRNSLLTNLSRLFVNYPLQLFLSSGDPHPWTRIELSYLLIVGNEMPNEKQQELIDNLYINDNILLMSYPMMLATMNSDYRRKNVLSMKAKAIEALTLQVPESLAFNVHCPDLPSDDPYGIRTAALGRAWQLDPQSVTNAGEIKKALYRSKGLCEKLTCGRPLIVDGRVEAKLTRIFNRHGELKEVKNWNHTYNVALVCPEHEKGFNDGSPYTFGHYHPLKERMSRRGPYRHELDLASVQLTEQWLEDLKPDLLSVLDINPDTECRLAAQVTDVALSLRKLTMQQRMVLEHITRNHYRTPGSSRCKRMADTALTHPIWNSLLRARLIHINKDAVEDKQVEPALFSHELMRKFEARFRDRAFYALNALLHASPSRLKYQLGRIGEHPR